MLFNSYEFIFLFLPITLIGFFLVARRGQESAIGWLVLSSLFFYGWWNPIYLILILISMVVNFGLGELLSRAFRREATHAGRIWLTLGIVFNLSLLGYFKYAVFLVANVNALTGTTWDIGGIVLPLAISFFTFQQITYLVDAYKGITQEYRFSHYALFVTFFPQLIAGPIVHHGEMLPQFMRTDAMKPRITNISIGISIFAIGLFKKTVLADGVAQYVTPVFEAASAGETLTLLEAWGGALAYTLQLYFDFSGYSDMAIGAARMFGIRLPLNFHSPYKATSIVEFWRRWHMTLSRFLRDYVYIALGGNRRGNLRRYKNLMLTMLLGGLWHGAGWTFVVWGGLHGVYLVVNHAWSKMVRHILPNGLLPRPLGKFLAWLITFLAVVVGWVFFRAEDFHGALAMLEAMAGFNGVAIPNAIAVRIGAGWDLLASLGVGTYLGGGTVFVSTYLWIGFLLPFALIMPNTQQVMERFEPALNTGESNARDEIRFAYDYLSRIRWRPTPIWGVAVGAISALAVLSMTSISEFLYFQF